jgi:Family of unknown function (DUF6491)
MPNKIPFYTRIAAISLVCLSVVPVVHAQDAVTDKEPIRCVKIDRIENVDVIDNENVVFQIGINDYYLNTLPYACNGLRLNESIMYRTSTNELCDIDVITVLDKIGPGFQAGPSCGLGKFKPITREEIKTLKASLKK